MSDDRRPPLPGIAVTLREVYTLVEGTRKELLAEMHTVSTKMDNYVTNHTELHRVEMGSAAKQRSALARWAVTTGIAIVAVVVAAYAAFG